MGLRGLFDQGARLFEVELDAFFAAFVGDLEADRVEATAVAQCQVAHSPGAGVEALVEQAAAGTIDPAGLPEHLNDFIARTAL